jgi:hypothetical protein
VSSVFLLDILTDFAFGFVDSTPQLSDVKTATDGTSSFLSVFLSIRTPFLMVDTIPALCV